MTAAHARRDAHIDTGYALQPVMRDEALRLRPCAGLGGSGMPLRVDAIGSP